MQRVLGSVHMNISKKVKFDRLGPVDVSEESLENIPIQLSEHSHMTGLGFVFMNNRFTTLLRRKVVSVIYRLALGHSNQRVIFQNIDDKKQHTTSTTNASGSDVLSTQYHGTEKAS